MTRITLARSALVAPLLVAVLVAAPAQTPPVTDGWRTFEGRWSAAGERHTLPTEGDRPATILRVSGTLVFTNAGGLGRGFRAEAIGFDAGRGDSVGRAVWTDGRGHQIFSDLKGEAVTTGRKTVGTFTGGTGPYAGVTGDYELTWKFVVQGEDAGIQAVTVALRGRVRLGSASQ